MLGWQLFKHAVLMIIRNFGDIAKIGALPIGVGVVLISALSITFAERLATSENEPSVGAALPIFLIAAVILFCMFWFVVSWHRYVLLEEMPNGWMNGPKPEVKNYFFAGVKLFFIAFAMMIPAVTFSILLSWAPVLLALVLFIYAIFVAFFMFRISLILPGAAVGNALPISEALDRTKGQLGTYVVLILCSFGLGFALQIVIILTAFIPLIGILVALGVQIFTALLNVSIMTTLYGYFIEKRAL